MADDVDYVVIGAGISGLGFANWIRERDAGARVLVLEREDEPGGYCRTVRRAGFVWDYSGHFFHFKHPEIESWLRARMPGQVIETVTKQSVIRYAGRDIEFPFQKNIHQLPQDEFIDDIPFPETQNYVKRILGTAEDYRRLYGGGVLVARQGPAPDLSPVESAPPLAAASARLVSAQASALRTTRSSRTP